MIKRIDFDQEGKKPGQIRREFDSDLMVRDWETPGHHIRPELAEQGAPGWWEGDEEASQGFLASMGVVLD